MTNRRSIPVSSPFDKPARERVSRQRPRRRRTLSTVELELRAWSAFVRRVEIGNLPVASGCPACDGQDARDSRDLIEAVIQRGGKRGKRVALAVAALDERFEKATVSCPGALIHAGWWRRRTWS